MQSYLQYRRLGDSIRAQLDHAHAQHNAKSTVKKDLNGGSESDSKSSSSAESVGRISNDHIVAGTSNPDSQSLEENGTQRSEKLALAHSLAGVDIQKQLASTNQPADLFIVGWDGRDDPQNPMNYSFSRRLVATLLVSALAWVVGAASSINSGVLPQNTAAFGVSDVVGSLVTGVYLLGFAAGSLVSGPLSEILGRNVVYTASLTLFMIFIMGSALAPNIGAQLAFRFLAGIFGCPPLTCAGGTIADLWNPLEKTIYFPMYAILSFGGPVLGPVIASYMGQTGVLSWRWTAWIILIMSGAILVLIILFQPETYSPLLLKWKGKQLRRITGDTRFRSEMDMEKIGLFSRIGSAMKRQVLITIHEPIILLISLYMTVLYIVLFTFFDGYTYIFTDVHGLSQGLTNIVWVAMYVGISLATFLVFPIYRWTKKEFTQAAQAVNGADPATDPHALDGVHTQPEIRLWFAMFGAPAIPISLFWMGWTDFENISVWSPILASSLFGFGTICVFISSYMYVIDSYSVYAASALGFMTVSRYCAAGGMAVVGIPFYENMGVHWTLTILGCISALLVPVPYVFYVYGPVIRRWSRYAVAEESKA
ncbi:Putative Major facilitator superfamily transporter [Penicillium brasilianum]|nr:Putative Major facilitator superfamily transporter [Penicillium brasilianum]